MISQLKLKKSQCQVLNVIIICMKVEWLQDHKLNYQTVINITSLTMKTVNI